MRGEFKNVEIGDREWVERYLRSYPCPSLEYNFTTFFIWQQIYNIRLMEHNGFLLCLTGKGEKQSFLFPVGDGDEKSEVDFLLDYAKEQRFRVHFHALTSDKKDFLEKNYPGRFEFFEDRNAGDYVYTKESLKTLTGKKLAAKRNHINRFVENHPEWEYVPINSENIHEAVMMHKDWCKTSGCESEPGLYEESCAVSRALKYFKELELSGGMIKTRDGVCAFSIGDRLNDNTFLVHIEKAFASVQGAYPMINKQFVIENCDGFEFVNREDDTGDEGLRRAKLSYQPYEIVRKFNAREI